VLHVLNLKLVRGPIPDAEAVERVRLAVANARLRRQKLVLVVHGYGSGGEGGSNRNAIRAWINHEVASGRLRTGTPGELLGESVLRELKSRFSGHLFTELIPHIRSRNPGVTLIELF
jgi:hypothetical protein